MFIPVTGATPGGGGGGAGAPGYFWARVVVLDFIIFLDFFITQIMDTSNLIKIIKVEKPLTRW